MKHLFEKARAIDFPVTCLASRVSGHSNGYLKNEKNAGGSMRLLVCHCEYTIPVGDRFFCKIFLARLEVNQ